MKYGIMCELNMELYIITMGHLGDTVVICDVHLYAAKHWSLRGAVPPVRARPDLKAHESDAHGA